LCGLSAPCGKTAKEGLPVGMQILGNHFEEARVLKLADAFERAGGFEG
jgi:aspartyl-tRNA(Asn)/glutamyl-tRNA(Gln) amidotransferase subunit A